MQDISIINIKKYIPEEIKMLPRSMRENIVEDMRKEIVRVKQDSEYSYDNMEIVFVSTPKYTERQDLLEKEDTEDTVVGPHGQISTAG